MDDGSVRIKELRLRVPGMSAEEGRAFGEDVVRVVSAGLTQEFCHQELGALSLRVTIPSGTVRGDIARIVGEKILGAAK